MLTITIALFLLHVLRSRKFKMQQELNYKLLESIDQFELREYRKTTRISVILKKELKKRINKGFQILFSYIDGKNGTHEKISLVSPVVVEMLENSAKMSFIVPHDHTLSKLPQPFHDRIIIEESKSKKYLCYKFDGFATNNKLLARQNALKNFITKNSIKTLGPYEYHNYNAPYTIFKRHNEIVVPVEVLAT